MPALPSPDPRFSWRRAAARGLRKVAERLEPRRGSDPAGPSVASAVSDSATPVRGFDVDGAPEHWVQLLRDAGLVSAGNPAPVVRAVVRAAVLPAVRPAVRLWTRFWSADRARQVVSSDAPPPVVRPDMRASSRAWDADPAPQRVSSQGAYVQPAQSQSLRLRLPSNALQAAALRAETPPVSGPDKRASGSKWDAGRAPQRVPVLRLRTKLSETPLLVGPDMRASGPTSDAGQATQHTSTPAARTGLRGKPDPEHAGQDPHRVPSERPSVVRPARGGKTDAQHPEQAPLRDPQAPQRPHPEPRSHLEPQPQNQPQGHPSTITAHATAPAIAGNWPELAPRPATQAPQQTAGLVDALGRHARLNNEQLAV